MNDKEYHEAIDREIDQIRERLAAYPIPPDAKYVPAVIVQENGNDDFRVSQKSVAIGTKVNSLELNLYTERNEMVVWVYQPPRRWIVVGVGARFEHFAKSLNSTVYYDILKVEDGTVVFRSGVNEDKDDNPIVKYSEMQFKLLIEISEAKQTRTPCQKCFGTGWVYYSENQAPLGSGMTWLEQFEDVCPDCVDAGKCPRCQGELSETDLCQVCGYQWSEDSE